MAHATRCVETVLPQFMAATFVITRAFPLTDRGHRLTTTGWSLNSLKIVQSRCITSLKLVSFYRCTITRQVDSRKWHKRHIRTCLRLWFRSYVNKISLARPAAKGLSTSCAAQAHLVSGAIEGTVAFAENSTQQDPMARPVRFPGLVRESFLLFLLGQ